MGISDKPQENKEVPKSCCRSADSSVDKKWVIAGIQLRAPLKPLVLTVTADHQEYADDCSSTTPTSEGSRIPSSKGCPPPPPPRKCKPPSRGCTKDFFCPPDLDSVFIRRHHVS